MSESLSEAAVERIVRRAIQLDLDADDRSGQLDVSSVVAAAEELGISRESVLESLAIEQLGPEPEGRMLDPVFGARWVMVQRTITGRAEVTFDGLDEWLTDGHHLRREERQGFSAVWRRRSDVAASLQRSVRGLSGGGRLGTVAALLGHVAQIDADTCVVRVVADRTASRTTHIGVAGASGAGGVAVAAGMATVAPPLAAAGLPVIAVAGIAAIGSKRAAGALASELTQLLDQIAGAQPPPPAMGIRLKRRKRS